MSKLYSALLLIASLFAMMELGMAILVAITEIDHLIAPTNNPYGIGLMLLSGGETDASDSRKRCDVSAVEF